MRPARLLLAGLLLMGLSGIAAAQEKFPSRPITLINPFTAGGPVDVHFRVLAKQAEKVFGVPVVVENKPGASATLGPAAMAATAKPDGYTLSNLSTGIYSLPHMQKVTFDPAKDFTYVIHLAGYRLQVAVRREAPWRSWKDLVAAAQAAPGTISYGSTGSGGVIHLAMEQIGLSSGIKLLHVPFRGASEVQSALLGGHVQLGPQAGTARDLFESGEFRSLLSITPERNPRAPDVPSLTDIGVRSEIDLSFPYGIGGPKGMDPAIVKILHDGFKRAAETAENKAVMEQLDLQDRYLDSAAYRTFALKQIEGNRRLLEALGLVRSN
jgi:tripartite-type tricarboxylate transporter receptor subunit TctC